MFLNIFYTSEAVLINGTVCLGVCEQVVVCLCVCESVIKAVLQVI